MYPLCVYVYVHIYVYIYIYICTYTHTHIHIGVPWRGVSFRTLSTGRFVLNQYVCKGAESAEHAETVGYTYEGTPTTAWTNADADTNTNTILILILIRIPRIHIYIYTYIIIIVNIIIIIITITITITITIINTSRMDKPTRSDSYPNSIRLSSTQ